MHPDDKAQWEKVRKGGRLRYVLRQGVLLPGAALFVGMTLAEWWRSDSDLAADRLLISGAICLLGGALFGLARWAWNESVCRYEQRH